MIARHLGNQRAATAILTISAAMLPGPRVAAGLSFDAPQDAAPRVAQLSATPLFDSGEHPSATVSALGRLSRAVFLSEARIVLLRGEDQLTVWDFNNDFRLTAFSDSGDVLGTRRANLSPLYFRYPLAMARLGGVFRVNGH